MAKKSKSNNQKKQEEERSLTTTLEAVEAMSDSDSSDDDDDDEDTTTEEANAEAQALRQAIADGAFDHLLKKFSEEKGDDDDDDVDVGEADDESSDRFEQVDITEGGDDDSKDNDSEQEGDERGSDESSADESDSEKEERVVKNDKALSAVLDELTTARKGMPWAETFDVIPHDPLPFTESPLDIHDDLKREVAFYNLALEAVKEARNRCNDIDIPFSRPDDFFAEMVKTDDHMAKVKDRLIFETKKMDAVAQRKGNKEQRLRSKEKKANKLAEKARRKKEHFRQVDEWAKSAASNRGGGALDDDNDDGYLERMVAGGPNKKRMAADRKYGHGGKRGRFKQTDPKSLNDMSQFNPRGNFSGGSKVKKGSGANRKGKRARDAARARR